ncbi:MAG TPA: gliding motility-associated C-terminal domain-containing protein [Bacteroidia bacterium]|jgi:gliding motility-associated-like protein|nr:gliding motility-associated C-terminal domain-containing protein [Bacteroidia bacterium]
MYRFFFFFFLVVAELLRGQNLVPNPGFEMITNCPNNVGEISYAQGWNPVNTPDYVNACAPEWSGLGIPDNISGYQFPASGSAYASIVTYYPYPFYEYVYIQLTQPLVAGQRYCAGFKWVPGNFSTDACSNIGMLFTQQSPVVMNLPDISNGDFISSTPQVLNPDGVINHDTLNWSVYHQVFTATGGEDFVTVGYFTPYTSSNSTFMNPGSSSNRIIIILLDDITVRPVINSCDDQAILPNVFTPNGDDVNDYWVVPEDAGDVNVKIYNRWGNIVYESEKDEHDCAEGRICWNGNDMNSGLACVDGVYYYILQSSDGTFNSKGFISILR